MILRSRQTTFVDNSIEALHKHNNTLSVACTGFGKTICLSAITDRMLNGSGTKALIVQHRDELLKQNSETFLNVCPDRKISFFNAERKSFRGQVVFAMIQTIVNHLDSLPAFDLVVFDEAHHNGANSYRKLTEKVKDLNSNVKILGVTATPQRSDNKGLKETFDNVADIVTIGEMVNAGHLVEPRGMVIDIGTQQELQGVKKSANEYDMAEVEAIQNKTVLNNKVAEKWLELSPQRVSVAFCATIKHAIDVKNTFRGFGIEAEAIHSQMPIKERRAILSAHNRGEIQVLTNPMILTEGWDN